MVVTEVRGWPRHEMSLLCSCLLLLFFSFFLPVRSCVVPIFLLFLFFCCSSSPPMRRLVHVCVFVCGIITVAPRPAHTPPQAWLTLFRAFSSLDRSGPCRPPPCQWSCASTTGSCSSLRSRMRRGELRRGEARRGEAIAVLGLRGHIEPRPQRARARKEACVHRGRPASSARRMAPRTARWANQRRGRHTNESIIMTHQYDTYTPGCGVYEFNDADDTQMSHYACVAGPVCALVLSVKFAHVYKNSAVRVAFFFFLFFSAKYY
jgi:hypothetical protein